jgi:drug/metabolite transporter (DMT)-like permease
VSPSPQPFVSEPENSRRAMVLMVTFGFLWVVVEFAFGSRLAGQYNLMQVVWSRYAVHLAMLLLMFGWRRPERLWRTTRPVYHMTRSLLMLVMPASFALAVGQGTTPNTVSAVLWLSPLLIVGIARIMLGERVTWWMWASAGVGALAAVVMYEPSLPQSPWLLVLPTLMALSFSVYVVMTRALRFEDVRANLLYTALGVFLVLTPLMPVVWVTPSLHDAAVMAAIGVLGLIGLLALDRSAASAPVSAVAPVLYLHVVGMAGAALMLYGNQPSRQTLSGAAVIVAIAVLLWSRESWRGAAPGAVHVAHVEGPAR